MDKSNALSTVTATLLVIGGFHSAFAADAAPQTNAVSSTQDSDDLIVRVQRALARYGAACAIHDREAILDSMTSFAVIEYAGASADRFVAVNALTTEACWQGLVTLRDHSIDRPMVVYRTNEPNAVFIEYTLSIGWGAEAKSIRDLALVEIEGDRIARIRDYAAPVPDR